MFIQSIQHVFEQIEFSETDSDPLWRTNNPLLRKPNFYLLGGDRIGWCMASKIIRYRFNYTSKHSTKNTAIWEC